MKTLSDKPSEFLIEALDDLEQFEQTPGMKVNMATWLTECEGCFAGAVMYCSLNQKAPNCGLIRPGDLDGEFASKLIALNEFRHGRIHFGLSYMGITTPDGIPMNVTVIQYADSPRLWKKDMRRIAALLAEHGL